MDYSHVIIFFRNNVLQSGHHTKCTGCLKLPNQKEVVWQHWIDAYKHDHLNVVKIHKKLTSEHVFLNCASKMRNSLAEEVLDSDMVRLMYNCCYQASKQNDGDYLSRTIKFLENTSVLVKIFRDMRPIKTNTDTSWRAVKSVRLVCDLGSPC